MFNPMIDSREGYSAEEAYAASVHDDELAEELDDFREDWFHYAEQFEVD